MNVFVLTTGRTGSTAFSKACGFITNFTSGHETRLSIQGDERLNYPENHIETDNRLSWFLGSLDRRYGDSSYYVFLKRDPQKSADSYLKRSYLRSSIVNGFHTNVLMRDDAVNKQSAVDLITTMNSNIEHFLKDKSNVFHCSLEDMDVRFPEFWKWIEAEGDMDAAMASFKNKTNPSFKLSATDRFRLIGNAGKHFLKTTLKIFNQ